MYHNCCSQLACYSYDCRCSLPPPQNYLACSHVLNCLPRFMTWRHFIDESRLTTLRVASQSPDCGVGQRFSEKDDTSEKCTVIPSTKVRISSYNHHSVAQPPTISSRALYVLFLSEPLWTKDGKAFNLGRTRLPHCGIYHLRLRGNHGRP